MIYYELVNQSVSFLVEPIYKNDDDSTCLSRCNSNTKCVYAYFLNGNCGLYNEKVSEYLKKTSISKKSKLYKKLNMT